MSCVLFCFCSNICSFLFALFAFSKPNKFPSLLFRLQFGACIKSIAQLLQQINLHRLGTPKTNKFAEEKKNIQTFQFSERKWLTYGKYWQLTKIRRSVLFSPVFRFLPVQRHRSILLNNKKFSFIDVEFLFSSGNRKKSNLSQLYT